MLPPLPRCSGRAYSSLKNHPSVSAFPDSTIGSACTSSFSRFARRSLALRPAHSRSHLGDRYPRASDISSPPCLPRLLPAGANRRVGLAPTGKAPPCHGARGSQSGAAPSQAPAPVGARHSTSVIVMVIGAPTAPRGRIIRRRWVVSWGRWVVPIVAVRGVVRIIVGL